MMNFLTHLYKIAITPMNKPSTCIISLHKPGLRTKRQSRQTFRTTIQAICTMGFGKGGCCPVELWILEFKSHTMQLSLEGIAQVFELIIQFIGREVAGAQLHKFLSLCLPWLELAQSQGAFVCSNLVASDRPTKIESHEQIALGRDARLHADWLINRETL